jgi:hypothetical protein
VEGGYSIRQIMPAQVLRAIEIADCLRSHARRAFTIMGGDATESKARAVWTWCTKNLDRLRDVAPAAGITEPAVKPSILAQYNVAGIKDAPQAKSVLDRLEVKGWTRRQDIQRQGVRPLVVYHLHPSAYK